MPAKKTHIAKGLVEVLLQSEVVLGFTDHAEEEIGENETGSVGASTLYPEIQ